jgi:uncharacterized protein YdcH (DUF465 family)
MGIRDQALGALRRVFGDERDAREVAESPSADALRHAPSSTYAIWGREDIGGLLSVSQNLMDRYADYEAMNDYPDIRCFTGDMKVYAVGDHNLIVPMTIRELASSSERPDILAFDRKKKLLVKVAAEHPRISGRNALTVRLELSNGEMLRVTPNHKILCVEAEGHPPNSYVEAGQLKKGAFLVGARAGFDTTGKSMLTVKQAGGVWLNEDPIAEGYEKEVYDITTSTHNLLVNGVICHNSAFHYFANDSTQPNMDNGRVAWVDSPDQAVVDMADTLIKRRLRLEDDLFSIAYTLCQYGNDFEEVLVTEDGVVGLNNLAAPTMRRVEKLNGSLIGYVQDVTGRFTANQDELRRMLAGSMSIPKHVALFEDWQACHFRMRSTTRRSPYGVSVSEGARWIWKRLVMLEDAVMIYKLTRSPARYAFYVDVTDVPPNRVEGFLKKAKRDLKKKKMVNPNNNFLDMRYNPLANDEDFFIAVRDGRALSRVEVLSGPDYQNVDDVQYFQRKLHGALMVPRAYLGQDSPIQGRAILSNEDVRAARVSLQIQKELKNGIERLIRTDLAARGHRNPWAVELDVKMTVPSNIYELAAMEVKNARADFAARIQPYVSMHWLLENVFKLSDDEIREVEIQRQREANIADSMGMDPSFSAFTGGRPPDTEPPPAPAEGAPPEADAGAGGYSEVPQPGYSQVPSPGYSQVPSPGFSEVPAPAYSQVPISEARRPNKNASRSEWVAYDRVRRTQERRDRESRQNHQKLVDMIGNLQENDAHFARRLEETSGFLKDFKDAALRRVNGQVSSVPSASGSRSPRLNGR